ncbi:glucosamine-fructose-6-phosphate aminotransferase (plasmid) [Cereibacter sphaeroides]|uniref:glucosamine-fructose-6-phosphate aminotransferase n=1 Tax=Cereibacter sphaeroides TaxID=1063 RepID=UPI000F52C55A|nr:glucosamine-fructose-6-phosphate aminotransferase [Cereibacter sphaeroides]AZB66373.1 glucosamine-fructose-6-phosphate aminotransferase [Cereibacter sphaeroides]AZB71181.1 glucosamine-fructose-6-phosphate aminotransferase [Cereibacter sphaeroides]
MNLPAGSSLSRATALAGPFDAAGHRRDLEAALAAAETAARWIPALSVERLVLVGGGEAQLLAQPALDLVGRTSRLATFALASEEARIGLPPERAPGTLVLLSAPDPELAETLAARGAAVWTLAPMAPEALCLQALAWAVHLLAARGEIAAPDAVCEGLAALSCALGPAKAAFEPEAARLAARLRAEPYQIVTGAGGAWPVAHRFALSSLERGLRLPARPVHAADFFHGTLELVEPGVSLLLVKGEDALRPLALRVERFVGRYTDRLRIVDAAAAELPGLGPRLRALATPVILAALLERVEAHLGPPAPRPGD